MERGRGYLRLSGMVKQMGDAVAPVSAAASVRLLSALAASLLTASAMAACAATDTKAPATDVKAQATDRQARATDTQAPAIEAKGKAAPLGESTDCSTVAPYAGNPTWRPSGPAVEEITEVQSITACRYINARLLSSLRLEGEEATAAAQAMIAAPEGGGPFDPAASCVPVDMEAEGVEQLVLYVDAKTDATISLRYGGCSSNGQDDGTTVRALTTESLAPFLQGPNRTKARPYGVDLY
jgi:hypothetical protein